MVRLIVIAPATAGVDKILGLVPFGLKFYGFRGDMLGKR